MWFQTVSFFRRRSNLKCVVFMDMMRVADRQLALAMVSRDGTRLKEVVSTPYAVFLMTHVPWQIAKHLRADHEAPCDAISSTPRRHTPLACTVAIHLRYTTRIQRNPERATNLCTHKLRCTCVSLKHTAHTAIHILRYTSYGDAKVGPITTPPQIVTAAVQQNPMALCHVTGEMSRNLDLLKTAIRGDIRAFALASRINPHID